MRNDDLARQDRMVVRHVCIWVSRSVLKLNFKPIPKSLDADPDAGRAYRRPDYFGFFQARYQFLKRCPISGTLFSLRLSGHIQEVSYLHLSWNVVRPKKLL